MHARSRPILVVEVFRRHVHTVTRAKFLIPAGFIQSCSVSLHAWSLCNRYRAINSRLLSLGCCNPLLDSYSNWRIILPAVVNGNLMTGRGVKCPKRNLTMGNIVFAIDPQRFIGNERSKLTLHSSVSSFPRTNKNWASVLQISLPRGDNGLKSAAA